MMGTFRHVELSLFQVEEGILLSFFLVDGGVGFQKKLLCDEQKPLPTCPR